MQVLLSIAALLLASALSNAASSTVMTRDECLAAIEQEVKQPRYADHFILVPASDRKTGFWLTGDLRRLELLCESRKDGDFIPVLREQPGGKAKCLP